MTEAGGSRFLSLADELLLSVIEHVGRKEDLAALARTCSHLQALAEPFLYRSILIRKGLNAMILSLAIQRRPARALEIHKLQIRYLYIYKEGIEVLNAGLQNMTRLQELTIEAPCCNDSIAHTDGWISKGKIDYASFFEFASSLTLEPQPRVQVPLQTFILHSHGEEGREFQLGRNAVIFRHPTLRNLTLSCFDIGEDLDEVFTGRSNSTPLNTLIFDECNISPGGLTAILSVPKALERLTLGERIYHTSPPFPRTPLLRHPDLLLRALALQQKSLRYLKHIGGYCHIHPHTSGLSMTILSNIREMEFCTNSVFLHILRESTIPSTLETLRLLRPLETGHIVLDTLLNTPGWLTNVPRLDYVLDCYGSADPKDVLKDLWRPAHRRDQINELVAILAKQGVRRVKVLSMQGWNYIPPYMFGEELPVEVLAYDSAVPLVFGDIIMPQPTKVDSEG